jgi:hypothetical protein
MKTDTVFALTSIITRQILQERKVIRTKLQKKVPNLMSSVCFRQVLRLSR